MPPCSAYPIRRRCTSHEGWLEKLQKLTDERDKKIQDILSKEGKVLHFESGDVTYDAEQIGIELKKIKEDFTKAVNDLAKEYHLEVPAEVDVTVKTNREAYEKLLDEYADYRRKIANINKQYDEQLKDAGDDESLKSRINTKRNQITMCLFRKQREKKELSRQQRRKLQRQLVKLEGKVRRKTERTLNDSRIPLWIRNVKRAQLERNGFLPGTSKNQ